MIVRFAEHGPVDVVNADCEFRPCFRFGFDKGPFEPGRGYTSHYDKPRPVCLERHLYGCPHRWDVVDICCDNCGSKLGSAVPREHPVEQPCPSCGDTGIYFRAVLLAPVPCCAEPRVANRPHAYRQRCQSCGKWLTGVRLAGAREASS